MSVLYVHDLLLHATNNTVIGITGAGNIRQNLTGFTTRNGFLTLASGHRVAED